jgi:hypothetical protein
MNRKIILLFLFLTIVAPGVIFSAPQTLTKCNVQPRKLSLQKTSKLLRVSGTVLSKGTNEYHLQVQSDLTAKIRLTSSSQIKLDIYLLDPPTAIQKGVSEWYGTFSPKKEYVLAVNNCSGMQPAKFQMIITPY